MDCTVCDIQVSPLENRNCLKMYRALLGNLRSSIPGTWRDGWMGRKSLEGEVVSSSLGACTQNVSGQYECSKAFLNDFPFLLVRKQLSGLHWIAANALRENYFLVLHLKIIIIQPVSYIL